MPRRIPGQPGACLRRILREAEGECRRARRSCRGELHRDARQNRIENISREKETRPCARSRTTRYLSAPLHDGHIHAHSLRRSRTTRPPTGLDNLYRSYFGIGHHSGLVDSFYRVMNDYICNCACDDGTLALSVCFFLGFCLFTIGILTAYTATC